MHKTVKELKKELEQLRRQNRELQCRLDGCKGHVKKRVNGLYQSRQSYSNIFNAVNEGIFIHDINNGAIVDANQAATEMYGYTREEFLNLSIAQLSSENESFTQAQADDWIGKAVARGPQSFDWQAKAKDGRIFWVNVRLKFAEIDGINRVIALVRDIDAQKKAEYSLAESTARYRLLFDNAIDYLLIIDPFHKNGPVIVDANPAACIKHGYSYEEMVGMPVSRLDDGPSRKKMQSRMKQVLSGNEVTFEAVHSRKDGSTFPVEVSAKLVQTSAGSFVLAIERDISERKKAETALIESEAKFKSILAHSHAAILLINEHYQIIYANQQIRKITGFGKKEVLGLNIRQVTGPEIIKTLDRLINGKNKTSVFEFSITSKSGKERWLESRSSVYKTGNGQVFLVIQLLDISDRKSVETALIQSEKKYRNLIDNSLAGIYITQKSLLRYFNLPFAHIFGYEDSNELLGMNIKKLVAPGSWSIVEREIRQREAFFRTSSHYEFRAIKKDGTLIDVEVLDVSIEYNGKPAVQGTLIDITERKQAERALLQSEQRYRQLFDSLPYGGELLDKNGYIISCSKNTTRLIGYTPEDLRGKHITSILTPESHKTFKEKFPLLQAGNPVSAEISLIHKNGNVREVLRAGQPILNENGEITAVLSINLDITEIKLMQQALNESEQRFKTIFNQSKACMILVDIETPQKILDVNQAAVEYYGYSYEQFIHMNMNDINAHPVTERHSLISENGLSPANYFEFKHRLAGGELRDVEVYASPITMGDRKLMYVIIHDITDRKKASKEINRLATVVAQSDESVVITGTDGIIQYVNRAFEEITGFSEQEALGKTPRILKSGKHEPAFYKELWKTITAGSKWQGLFINKHKNGQLIYLKASILPIKNEDGEIINFASIGRDITRDRILEEQLTQAQKMEAIGTLSGGIAHDFNNLLTVINGHAEIALMKIEPQEKVHRDLISILNAGKRAERLTSQLLAFSRKQVHQLKILDMNLTISELDKMIRRLIPEDIEIVANYGEQLPFIKADPTQIEQIIINLIINARDAIRMNTREGAQKRITISTQMVDLDDLFVSTHPACSTGPHILLKVSDTGIGMDEDVRNRIFEPFFTTKEVGKGTGLGLSTVYGIVKQNNGSIYVESAPGAGASFSVYWPVSREAPQNETIEELSTSELSGNETILFVEDDDGVRDFACSALKSFGYRIIEANLPKSALEIMRQQNINIDLLITDLIMPGMNGKELSERLSSVIQWDKTLFVSGYSMDYISSEGQLEEGIQFLQKPYSVKELLKRVREILDK